MLTVALPQATRVGTQKTNYRDRNARLNSETNPKLQTPVSFDG